MYPSDDELEKIKTWPLPDWRGLMQFIRPIWNYSDCGYWVEEGSKYSISSGGWSGNEDIIGALQENYIFWVICWFSSQRGGHHVFVLPTVHPKEETITEHFPWDSHTITLKHTPMYNYCTVRLPGNKGRELEHRFANWKNSLVVQNSYLDGEDIEIKYQEKGI